MSLEERVARANQQVWDTWPKPISHENLKEVRLAAARAAIAIVVEEAAKAIECDCCDVCGESPGYPKCANEHATAIRNMAKGGGA